MNLLSYNIFKLADAIIAFEERIYHERRLKHASEFIASWYMKKYKTLQASTLLSSHHILAMVIYAAITDCFIYYRMNERCDYSFNFQRNFMFEMLLEMEAMYQAGHTHKNIITYITAETIDAISNENNTLTT